jgi:transposase
LFDILDHNLTAEDFDLFVTRLLRKIRGPVTLVIDRLGAHRSAVRSLQARYGPRLEVEWLPPYAPELNPTEHVWGHTKTGELANFIPDDVFHLGRKVASRLRKTRDDQPLLRSFFKTSKLPLQSVSRFFKAQ